MFRYFLSLFCVLFFLFDLDSAVFAQKESVSKIVSYEKNYDKYRSRLDSIRNHGLDLMDYHVHIMKDGTMVPETVLEYAKYTGLQIGMVENAGRKWLLSDNEKIAAYLDEAEKAACQADQNHRAFLIGIQINDRDWYKVISPENLARLDYVLADTLVMSKPDGSPQPLWELPKDLKTDPEIWMKEYFAHCLKVLDEPITIWADPLYLPEFCRDKADQLWTEDRMNALAEKAVRNHIAIEIQGPSPYPLEKFLRIALSKGAKICLGTNNFDDQPKSMEKWIRFFDEFKIRNDQLLHLKSK
ncbi:MAG: hypothetical protein Q4G69_12190 [Planctomycetia bacterium]|nr:hypothetical protein [Planctomycetia bacterium]